MFVRDITRDKRTIWLRVSSRDSSTPAILMQFDVLRGVELQYKNSITSDEDLFLSLVTLIQCYFKFSMLPDNQ